VRKPRSPAGRETTDRDQERLKCKHPPLPSQPRRR
jgi:hypothetical protein